MKWYSTVFLFVAGVLCYALVGTLSQLSKADDGTYPFSLSSVVLLAELGKLCMSVAFSWKEEGSVRSSWRALVGNRGMDWAVFVVPSLLYALNNMLDMYNNLFMDPATEQVLVQTKILTTFFFSWLVFHGNFGARKVFAVFLLFFGCVCVAWPSGDANTGAVKSFYVEPFGMVLILFYATFSGVASIYNEWLYKGSQKHESIHVCNARLYMFGICHCTVSHLLTAEGLNRSVTGLINGYNGYTWALVLAYCCMGLALSQVMKYLSNIFKLFISASSMYVQALLVWGIWGLVPTPKFVVGLVLVTVSSILYKLEFLLDFIAQRRAMKTE
eukprot:NODE_6918_length_1625_cov_10.714953.p1 GENE.NODE_6918_length_1625_cov_10.714953~~NODE_6918_length_1625_cov_10.714953.p1  ORF type:complete len:328 (+),score=88.82 NODE_6918_length_1625_cov_10.714953:193-1176(+)